MSVKAYKPRVCARAECGRSFAPVGPRQIYCLEGTCTLERLAAVRAAQKDGRKVATPAPRRRGSRPTHGDGCGETRMLEPLRCGCGKAMELTCPNECAS